MSFVRQVRISLLLIGKSVVVGGLGITELVGRFVLFVERFISRMNRLVFHLTHQSTLA